ncbi:unnamed protein product [Caenorhabditis sp. 36 PRJEB53466]|nr:unnamed protein product [Caenorhabditis sp. 36 PRJEB53466]
MMTWNSIFMLVASISLAICQLKEDQSLREACTHMEGVFTQRADGEKSTTGDTCEMKFQVATKSANDANEFCGLYAPWRLLKATHGKETVCSVEATMMCKPGWVQMFGYCYMMPEKKKHFTKEEATKRCAEEQAEIAGMRRRYIAGVWKRYFKGISQIWVRASAAWDQYIQLDAGDALALAFTGKHYNFSVAANSLITIDPNIKLQVLCEYKPPLTIAEIYYVANRYSQIYHPAVQLENGVLIRTASHYARGVSHDDTCEHVATPFMEKQIESFIPHDNVLAALSEHVPQITFTRSGGEVNYDWNLMKMTTCQVLTGQFQLQLSLNGGLNMTFIQNFTAPEPKKLCDNHLSSAIVHFPAKKAELRAMADSRSAPIWCKLGRTKKITYRLPHGFKDFDRENGLVFVHRVFKQEGIGYDGCEAECAKDNSHLSGFNSMEELKFIEKLAKDAGFTSDPPSLLYLGARRKPECIDREPFSKDVNDVCARGVVFQWMHNVANTPIADEMWLRDVNGVEGPSYFQRGQHCLHLVLGKPGWSDPNSTGVLDDHNCSWSNGCVCGK